MHLKTTVAVAHLNRKPCLRGRSVRRYQPALLPLEDRLPLGDAVLSVLAGASLLSSQTALPAIVPTAPLAAGLMAMPDSAAAGVALSWSLPAPTADAVISAFTVVAPAPRAQNASGHPSSAVSVPEPRGTETARVLEAPGTRMRADPGLAGSSSHGASRASSPVNQDSAADLLATLVGLQAPAVPTPASVAPSQEAQVKENLGKVPLYFEQNVGQTDASVHFFARGPGYGLYLTGTEAVMVLQPPSPGETLEPETGELLANPTLAVREPVAPAVVRMQFVGANAAPTVTGLEQQPGKINYFLGNDPAKWHTNINTFGKVHYDEVYPGIDLVYYGTAQNQVEYDFVVSPGADPNAIRLNLTGADRLELDANGDLVVHAGGQQLRQHKPFVYQEANGTRQEVASRFVLDGGQVRFDVAAYDAGRPLVIDPVLSYSTYLGGSGNDLGQGIAVDSDGNAYITGDTSSANFPTANPFQPDLAGTRDAFVVKLRADGSTLEYASYLGGTGNTELGVGIAVDGAGSVYITGHTDSTDFPTVNAFQPIYGGEARDSFVAKLRADGSALEYSTYLGGSGFDIVQAITVNEAGIATVIGGTASTNFPTVNAFQPNYGGGSLDAYVTQLQADGSALVFSTYLGGSLRDVGTGVAVNSTGSVFVSGSTDFSTDFPTFNPLQPSHGGGSDAFVARLREDGAALEFSTYLGGRGSESARSLALDGADNVFISGFNSFGDFPTVNAFQPNSGGSNDAFVAKLNPTGSALLFSTYLGGSGADVGASWDGLSVDADGNAVIMGTTGSTDFPTAFPLQPNNGGGNDVFVTKLRGDGSALEFSTYLGGSDAETGQGIAVDEAGNTLVTGTTASTNFPTANPFQPSNAGGNDAFISRISSSPVAGYYVYPDNGEVSAGVPFDLYVFALDADGNAIPDYTGEIAFFSTDEQAVLPKPYTYLRTDQGVAYFFEGVTFLTPGTQELYVFDTATYEVWGYAVFEVV